MGADEINGLLAHLDESFLLDSERYRNTKNEIITDFASKRIRPCSHCGKGAGITTGIEDKGIVWVLSG